MRRRLKASEVNHLRRLLGWVRREYGVFMTPDEIKAAAARVAPVIGKPSVDGQRRLVEWHQAAARVPKYVRAALRALEPLTHDNEGETIAHEERVLRSLGSARKTRKLSHRHAALARPALNEPDRG